MSPGTCLGVSRAEQTQQDAGRPRGALPSLPTLPSPTGPEPEHRAHYRQQKPALPRAPQTFNAKSSALGGAGRAVAEAIAEAVAGAVAVAVAGSPPRHGPATSTTRTSDVRGDRRREEPKVAAYG